MSRQDRSDVRKPNPIDVHVGSRVRLRRTLKGMSQEKLAEAVGLTFQQIQKYERGLNRIGAGRLYQFSRVLEVPVTFFFDDMPPEAEEELGLAAAQGGDEDPMARGETLELVRAYYRINDPVIRKRVFELAKSLGGMADLTEEDLQRGA